MTVLNSFTAATDYNFCVQMTEWPSCFLPTDKTFEGICLATGVLWGNFFKRSCEFFSYLKLFYKKLLNLVLSLFMNMSAK